MVVKSLTLTNFKSHENTVITFDDITSIIGTNDVGKSSIIKALKLICMHEDWPKSWIMEGADLASIEVVTYNGEKVKRICTLTSQSTIITNKDGVQKTLAGKKEAESFVRNVLKFDEVILDEASGPEDLNFVGVNEAPYMLGSKPETVLRKISGVVGTNSIEDARLRLMKESKKLHSDLQNLSEEFTSLNSSIDVREKHLDPINKHFEKIEYLYTEWNERQDKLKKLIDCRKNLHNWSSIYNTNDIEEKFKILGETQKSLERVKYSFHILDQIKLAASIKQCILPVTLSQQLIDMKKDHCEISKCYSMYNQLHLLRRILIDDQLEEAKSGNDRKALLHQINDLNIKRKHLLREMGICPTCGNKV